MDGDKEVQTEQSIEENNTQDVLSTTDKKLPEEEAWDQTFRLTQPLSDV